MSHGCPAVKDIWPARASRAARPSDRSSAAIGAAIDRIVSMQILDSISLIRAIVKATSSTWHCVQEHVLRAIFLQDG